MAWSVRRDGGVAVDRPAIGQVVAEQVLRAEGVDPVIATGATERPAVLQHEARAPLLLLIVKKRRRTKGHTVAAEFRLGAGWQKDGRANPPDDLARLLWRNEQIDQRVAEAGRRVLAGCSRYVRYRHDRVGDQPVVLVDGNRPDGLERIDALRLSGSGVAGIGVGFQQKLAQTTHRALLELLQFSHRGSLVCVVWRGICRG